jgi:hypothetical protein
LRELLEHLCCVLDLLRQHKLYSKASKCSFSQSQIEYLGDVISRMGVATDVENTCKMQGWLLPTNGTEMCGFWGISEYYYPIFFPRYGIIAKPLTQTKRRFQLV